VLVGRRGIAPRRCVGFGPGLQRIDLGLRSQRAVPDQGDTYDRDHRHSMTILPWVVRALLALLFPRVLNYCFSDAAVLCTMQRCDLGAALALHGLIMR